MEFFPNDAPSDRRPGCKPGCVCGCHMMGDDALYEDNEPCFVCGCIPRCNAPPPGPFQYGPND